jgi:hypothetical protein
LLCRIPCPTWVSRSSCRRLGKRSFGTGSALTTTLFAALNILDGKVIGECRAWHRHQEWMLFLRRVDPGFPSRLKLHWVMDNYGTHKEPHVQAWLNLVERW